MIRIFKKCSAIILVLVISICMSDVAVAKSNNVDNILKSKGIPVELITMMPTEQKIEIAYSNLVFDSYQKVSGDMGESNQDSDIISTMGTIDGTSMDFYISIYKAYPFNSTSKSMIVYVNYDWKITLGNNLEDSFGIAWDSSIWRALDNSSMLHYYTRYNNTVIVDEYQNGIIAYSNTNGVGWTVPLEYGYNYGYGRISLNAINPASTGTSQFHANYAHIKSSGTIGLSFYGISVSYTGSATADTRGTYLTYTY